MCARLACTPGVARGRPLPVPVRGTKYRYERSSYDRTHDRTPKDPRVSSTLSPTHAMRPNELRNLWQDVGSRGYSLPTVEFYGHTSGQHRSFSNFYEHAPFDFVLPACSRLPNRPARVQISFTEKAIMLCKAGVMGDPNTFDQILRATNPRQAKALGRAVGPWKQSTWEANVCEIAFEVVSQKFAAVPGLADILLATGNRVIAEMTRNDSNWGTGLDVGHADGSRPGRWRGTNILGWALMEARSKLQAASAADLAAPAAKKQRSFGDATLAEGTTKAVERKEVQEAAEGEGEEEEEADSAAAGGRVGRKKRR